MNLYKLMWIHFAISVAQGQMSETLMCQKIETKKMERHIKLGVENFMYYSL